MATSLSFPLLPPLPSTSHFRSNGSHFRPLTAAAVSTTGETHQSPLRTLHRDHHDDYSNKKKKKKTEVEESAAEFGGLAPLYDDGFGTKTVKDYFVAAKEIVKIDGGPPRWFCPLDSGPPIAGSPVLMYLPGIDGTGVCLVLHQKSLGKVFEVRCLHIPTNDRTPFEGLVKFVEKSVKHEHALAPTRPIYLVADSFGGCLALAVAAHNPSIDLVLVLINPATSYNKSQLQPFIPAMEKIPRDLYGILPFAFGFVMVDPFKMVMANVPKDLPLAQTVEEFAKTVTSLLPLLSDIKHILPLETLLWKLKLIKSGTDYSNSRLHAVEAEVLMLASAKDNLLPSGSEAVRLKTLLKNCRVRYFKDNGHNVLLEDGLNLLSVIKGTSTYRRSTQHDFVTDYLPPTLSEFKQEFDRDNRLFSPTTRPVVLSTLESGKIVRGLGGVPDEGPVILVGYHMLSGLEVGPLYEAFLREKNVCVRGLTHRFLSAGCETSTKDIFRFDLLAVFGALPVSPINMSRLLSRKSFVLLFPGGARESLHKKAEEYKLHWPDQPEFIRMATQFGATVVPFGVVGEDDVAQLAPGILPRVPGRFYFLFGKPFETKGAGMLNDRKSSMEMYSRFKSETENIMAYLKKKREEDPYRNVIHRSIYQNFWRSAVQVPTFEP